MNVVLDAELEGFVREQVESGRYGSPIEVVRDALCLLQEHERVRQWRLEELRREIQKGIGSGPATPLDFEALKAKGRALLAQEQDADG